jgi:hypothetical protein
MEQPYEPSMRRNQPQQPAQQTPQPGWRERGSGKVKFLIVIGVLVVIGVIIGATQAGGEKTTTTARVTASTHGLTMTTKSTASTASDYSSAEDAYVAAVVPILNDVSDALATIGEIAPKYPGWTDDEVLESAGALGMLQAMPDLVGGLERAAQSRRRS